MAGRFSTVEQKHDLHAQKLSSWKTHNTNLLKLSQKNQSRCSTSFSRDM